MGGVQPSSIGSSDCAGRDATNHSASDVFELAFFINADGSLRRQKFMEVRIRWDDDCTRARDSAASTQTAGGARRRAARRVSRSPP